MSNLESRYNLRSPGVKRLMREAIELSRPTEEYYACPLEDNLFEWHFTVRGPPGTEFDGGLYHGRIILPTQYPMQPPNIILLTPSGRFEINKKICLSISGYHPESWQPSWSIRTALLALIAFMPTSSVGTVGSLDYTPEERRILARRSRNFECPICGPIANKLLPGGGSESSLTMEESALLRQIALKEEEGSNFMQEKGEDIMHNLEVTANEVSDNIRQMFTHPGDNFESGLEVQDSLLRASIERSKRDRMWSAIIWAIISAITLLFIRRFFFL